MKLNSNFLLREIAGCFVVVPVGESVTQYNGMFTINDTGALLWKSLMEEKTLSQLVNILMEEYEIDMKTAKDDVLQFIAELTKINALCNI